jgi:hypothetical protein
MSSSFWSRGSRLSKIALAVGGLGAAGYLVLSVYSQPLATYRKIEPVRRFLNHALAHDSAGLAAQAGSEQPIRWVLAAMSQDSVAVREWAESQPRVTSTRRGDTLWVTLRRPGSTERCSPLYPLTAQWLVQRERMRLIHLSSLCPSVSRVVSPQARVE